MMGFCRNTEANRTGFTLLELLVVIGLMGLMMAFAIPAFVSMNRGGALRSATFQLHSNLSLARQAAITTRQDVSVLFPDSDLNLNDGTRGMAYSAYAVYGERDRYMAEWISLPNGIVFHADWVPPEETGTNVRNIFQQTAAGFSVDAHFPFSNSSDTQSVLGFTFRSNGTLGAAGFNVKGVYLTEGWVDPVSQDPVFLPNTPVFGLEIRPETGQARRREYNP